MTELPNLQAGVHAGESRVTPPPPPPHDPRPGSLQLAVLATLLVLGTTAVLVGSLSSLPYPVLIRHGGAFTLVYAALVFATWLPNWVLSGRIDRLLEKWIGNASSGFYGVMALSSFALLEVTSLLDAIASFDIDTFAFGEFIGELVTGFSVESLMNMIWATIWPGLFFSNYPATAVFVLVAVCWGVFSLGGQVLPHHTLQSRKERGVKRSGAETPTRR